MVDHYANWAIPLYVMAALYLFTAVTWFFVRPPRVDSERSLSV
jgi:hypothetical protein